MRGKENILQGSFVLHPATNEFIIPNVHGVEIGKESEKKEPLIEPLITFSQLEKKVIDNARNGREYSEILGPITVGSAKGVVIDNFLVFANFIYRNRNKFCFADEDWDMKAAVYEFLPTAYPPQRDKTFDMLTSHRPNFTGLNNPLSDNWHKELEIIKTKLAPLWDEVTRTTIVGRKSNQTLDVLNKQATIEGTKEGFVASLHTATSETSDDIWRRMMNRRFEYFVDRDLRYIYMSKPDCVLPFEVDGQTTYLQVQPDYIKRLREKSRIKYEQKLSKRILKTFILGDFKDSAWRDLSDYTTPYGQAMLVYNYLLNEIGRLLKASQPTRARITHANRSVRRVYLLSPEVKNPISREEVKAEIDFLREDGERPLIKMPPLTDQNIALAEDLIRNGIRALRKTL